jgi:hypothetical protein
VVSNKDETVRGIGAMRRFLGLAILLAAVALPARAQITPKYEISGGYQYMAYYGASGASRTNMNGAAGSITYNYYRWLGVSADVSGGYNRESSTDPAFNGATTTVFTYLAGPRFYPFGHHKLTLHGEAMFGGGYLRAGVPAVPPFPQQTLTNNAFAWMAGMGVDYSIRDHWAIRLQGDYLSTRFFSSTAGSQGNERAVVGVVYRFGVRGPHRHK